jgi:hypothetical protein
VSELVEGVAVVPDVEYARAVQLMVLSGTVAS